MPSIKSAESGVRITLPMPGSHWGVEIWMPSAGVDTDQQVTAASRRHPEAASPAPVIRTPGLDGLFNLLLIPVAFDRLQHQRGHLGVAGETEADQLAFAQFPEAQARRIRQQLRQAQTF